MNSLKYLLLCTLVFALFASLSTQAQCNPEIDDTCSEISQFPIDGQTPPPIIDDEGDPPDFDGN